MRLPESAFTLAVLQTAPVLRDVAANARSIAESAAAASADLTLTPELSLTGYDIGDAVHTLAVPCEPGSPFAAAAFDRPVIVGAIERGFGGPYNAALLIDNGVVAYRQRKIYLPTYGMFDEMRWFGRGASLEVCDGGGGWRIGVLVCEDFWHPGLAYVLATRGIDVLLVTAAAAGRGVWAGGAHGAFASADIWERMARTTAQQYGIYVALANRTGVEGALTFAGGSLIAGPDGTVLGRCDDHGVAAMKVEIRRSVLDAARRPYAHARDDDPAFVVRELTRGIAAP